MKHLAQIKEPYLKKQNEQYHYDEYIDRLESPRESTREKQWKEKGVLQRA